MVSFNIRDYQWDPSGAAVMDNLGVSRLVTMVIQGEKDKGWLLRAEEPVSAEGLG